MTEITLARANCDDIAGILHLQDANQIASGGMLSARFSAEPIQHMLEEMPLIVARRDDIIVGFLMTSTRETGAKIPVIQAMLEAYTVTPDGYVYGPICVATEVRGQRLAEAMFAELRRHLPGREGILFVRQDNPASLSAHRRMDMREVARFVFRDTEHFVFAYTG